ncbi:MAG TPA: TetR/AcrR family transcriptional regulator [Acidimicrobiales bacterium]|jgi:AcrR family transcriptional regulator
MGPAAKDGRRQRSVRTRARVVDAGERLFLDRGYLETTIEAVADVAGVAPQTVYYVFGTKRNLLAAVLDASIAGDVEPVAVLERPWFDEFGTADDPTSAVERLVEASVAILARASPIYEVIRQAAADPDVGVLLQENRRRRRDDQRRLIEVLGRSGHLRPGLDVDTAADVFYGLLNEEVFLLLTGDCGWEVDRFRGWATSLMRHQLVAPEGSVT